MDGDGCAAGAGGARRDGSCRAVTPSAARTGVAVSGAVRAVIGFGRRRRQEADMRAGREA